MPRSRIARLVAQRTADAEHVCCFLTGARVLDRVDDNTELIRVHGALQLVVLSDVSSDRLSKPFWAKCALNGLVGALYCVASDPADHERHQAHERYFRLRAWYPPPAYPRSMGGVHGLASIPVGSPMYCVISWLIKRK